VQLFQAKELHILNIPPGDEHDLVKEQREQAMEQGWRASGYESRMMRYVLSIIMHHVVSDGWSVDVLLRELATFYSARSACQCTTSSKPVPRLSRLAATTDPVRRAPETAQLLARATTNTPTSRIVPRQASIYDLVCKG